MMEKRFDVVGIANPIQDLVVDLQKLPDSNVNMSMNDYCFQGGGNVATAMVASAMLGLKSAMIGVVGDDIFGHANLADFAFNRVDTSHVIMQPNTRTDFCIAVTERAVEGKEFISKAGTCRQIQPDDLDEAFIQSAKVLHVGFLSPAVLRACDIIHAAGGKVSVDAAYYRPDIYENYARLDLFIGSETYYNAMVKALGLTTGREETMRMLQRQGPEIVIFTFGPEGCCGVSGDQYFEVPAFKVNAVDSTGAGDVFHGAFVYAYLQGWDVKRCARFCSGVSAIKCTRPGGRAGIPTLRNVMNYLDTGVIDEQEIDQRTLRYKHGFFGMR